MEYYNNKKIGKIYEYDGEAGRIITQDDEFMFNKKELLTNSSPNNEEIVRFYASTVPFGSEIFNFAREVEVLSEDDIKRLTKER